jgi:hypothetical protein
MSRLWCSGNLPYSRFRHAATSGNGIASVTTNAELHGVGGELSAKANGHIAEIV